MTGYLYFSCITFYDSLHLQIMNLCIIVFISGSTHMVFFHFYLFEYDVTYNADERITII
jgi:hypothetical protein